MNPIGSGEVCGRVGMVSMCCHCRNCMNSSDVKGGLIISVDVAGWSVLGYEFLELLGKGMG